MPDIVVDPGRLESALLKLGKLYGRGYLALHDADSRRFISRQDRERLRRRRRETRQKRARNGNAA